MMDRQAVKKALLYLVFGGGLIKLVSLGTLYFVVLGLGAFGYGEYTLVVAAISLLSVALRIVFGQIYQIELARLVGLKDHVAINLLRRQARLLVSGVLGFYLILLASAVLFFWYSGYADADKYIMYASLAGVHIATLAYKGVEVGTNRGFGYFKEQTYWDVIDSIWRFLFVLVFVVFLTNELSVLTLLLIDWVAIVFGWGIYFFFLRPHKPVTGGIVDIPKVSLLGLIRDHGVWFSLRLIIVELTANIRLWLIAAFLSVEVVGIFSIAKRIVQSGKILLPFGVVMNSFLSQNATDKQRLKGAYLAGFQMSMAISLVVIFLIALGAVGVVPYVFPEFGSELVALIIIMSGIYLFKAGSYAVNSVLGVDKKYKVTFYAVLVSLLAMLLVLPLLIQWLGVYGVAVEAVLNSCIAFVIAYKFMLKARPDFSISYRELGKSFVLIKNIRNFIKMES